MSDKPNLATIVPVPAGEPGWAQLTRGTRVILEDGTELTDVHRIELIATPNDIWRARIDCNVKVPVICAEVVEVETPRELSWLQRALLRMAGLHLDATTLASRSVEYERP